MKRLTKLAGTFLALVLTIPAVAAHHKQDEAASLLSRIESNIQDIREQSDRLMTYNRTPDQHDWLLHASELRRISEEADVIADLMKKFNAIKSDATYRQRYSFNQVFSLMAKISDSTETAIKLVNDDKTKVELAHPDYASKVESVFDSAGEAISVLDVAESWFELQESWQSQ